MEESTLYNVLDKQKVLKWRNEIETEDEYYHNYQETERERREDLLKKIPDKLKHQLHMYTIAVENRVEYLYYNLLVKVMNISVHMGMDLQSAFQKEEQ